MDLDGFGMTLFPDPLLLVVPTTGSCEWSAAKLDHGSVAEAGCNGKLR